MRHTQNWTPACVANPWPGRPSRVIASGPARTGSVLTERPRPPASLQAAPILACLHSRLASQQQPTRRPAGKCLLKPPRSFCPLRARPPALSCCGRLSPKRSEPPLHAFEPPDRPQIWQATLKSKESAMIQTRASDSLPFLRSTNPQPLHQSLFRLPETRRPRLPKRFTPTQPATNVNKDAPRPLRGRATTERCDLGRRSELLPSARNELRHGRSHTHPVPRPKQAPNRSTVLPRRPHKPNFPNAATHNADVGGQIAEAEA